MMSGIHDMASRMKAAGPDHTPSALGAECCPCRVCRAACKQLPFLQQLMEGVVDPCAGVETRRRWRCFATNPSSTGMHWDSYTSFSIGGTYDYYVQSSLTIWKLTKQTAEARGEQGTQPAGKGQVDISPEDRRWGGRQTARGGGLDTEGG